MFRKRFAAAVSIAALLTFAVAGCSSSSSDTEPSASASETPVTGGTLTLGGIPQTIDPMYSSRRGDLPVIQQAAEGLFAFNSKLEVKPSLAESYTYDTNTKTYIFKLREGVPFHDGTELTSKDVVATIERYAGSPPGANLGALMESVTAVDDYTVELITKTDSSIVPMLLAVPGGGGAYVQPASQYEGRPAADALTTIIGTGPYKLDNYVPDQEVDLSRFDGYKPLDTPSDAAAGKKVAYIDNLKFIASTDANIVNSLLTGAVDSTVEMQLNWKMSQLPAVENAKHLTVHPLNNNNFALAQFNVGEGIMSNQKLRQAALAAIDVMPVAVSYASSEDYVNLAPGLMAPGSAFESDAGSENFNQHDLKKVKKLLDETGYNGETIRFMIQAPDADRGAIITQQLKDAGFNIDAQVMDPTAFFEKRTDPAQWDMFLSGASVYADPLSVVFLQSTFPGDWNTPKKTELMAQLASAPIDERKAVWDELQGLIYEEVPFLTFGWRDSALVTTSKLQGVKPQYGEQGYYNLWLDQ